jgi:hypothetical protein
MAEISDLIRFEYEKSGQFRTVNAVGATVLGYTPSGLSIAFFTERPPLPKSMVHRRLPNGNLSEQPEQTDNSTGATIARDVEFVITLNLETTKNFLRLLQQSIDQVETQLAGVPVAQGKNE